MAGSVAFEALQWIWTLLPYMALLTALEAPRRAWGALICQSRVHRVSLLQITTQSGILLQSSDYLVNLQQPMWK